MSIPSFFRASFIPPTSNDHPLTQEEYASPDSLKKQLAQFEPTTSLGKIFIHQEFLSHYLDAYRMSKTELDMVTFGIDNLGTREFQKVVECFDSSSNSPPREKMLAISRCVENLMEPKYSRIKPGDDHYSLFARHFHSDYYPAQVEAAQKRHEEETQSL